MRRGVNKMFRLNGEEVNIIKFPDGTSKIELNDRMVFSGRTNEIKWFYDGDEEIFQLINLVDLINKYNPYEIF